MTKSVTIDGVEYVPKTEVSVPKIIGYSVDYENIYVGYSKLHANYPVGVTFEIESISGEHSSVYLTAKYAEELLEAIRK